MDLYLKDKTILVTGGSKGIGFACAKILAMEGAQVLISSRSEENLKSAAGEIIKITGTEPGIFPADVSINKHIQDLKVWVMENYGKLDGLVINAGGPPAGHPLTKDDEEWEKAFKTNFLSGVRLTREFIPLMQKNRFGRIVAITSTGMKQPIPNLVLSNANRLGLSGYLKTVSLDVAKDNVLINIVMPGAVNTGRLQSLMTKVAQERGRAYEEVMADSLSKIPAGRISEPEELGTFITFLLSGRNTYITGQAIAVDGGIISTTL
ncbi:MAG: SDR family oxidoreductase [Bacteroidetes bacterium]|nr:SDR family oxidoreductase [Bacteroidota bacterium]